MGLTSIEMHRLQPTLNESKSKSRARQAKGKEEVSASQGMLVLEVEGVAPNDLEVTRFVKRLSEQPMFQNVTLIQGRPVQVAGLVAREFQIRTEIPLDREFQLASGEAQR